MGMVRPPIVFYAFDLLQLNGKDLRGFALHPIPKMNLQLLLKQLNLELPDQPLPKIMASRRLAE
jgi:hypothetical protein